MEKLWGQQLNELNPDLNSLDYTIWDVLENKPNATSHLNVGLKEEWNKLSEEFILKASWYNNWKKW